jgi:serine/threonine protein kinase
MPRPWEGHRDAEIGDLGLLDGGSRRFEVRRLLGRGGMGDVFEAFDRETGWTVALKTLRNLDGESLYRFKKEFRALADLAHPNLVRYGELHCEGDQWFFTMELVEGVDFHRYVRTDAAPPAAPHSSPFDEPTRTVTQTPSGASTESGASAVDRVASPSFDEARLRASLGQLALAIDAVHASGRVHQDIKPSNAQVRPDGRVVLMDFGLVDRADAVQAGGRRAGTPRYMAPEQVRGERLGPEADWYAFGVLLFQALTGIPPFRGTIDEIVTAKCRVDAPRAHSLVAGVPADLDLLCHDLLRREPWQRPSGGEILRRLGVADRRVIEGRVDADEAAPFVGRVHELARSSGPSPRARPAPPWRSWCKASPASASPSWSGASSTTSSAVTSGARSCAAAATSRSRCRSARSTACSTRSASTCSAVPTPRSPVSSAVASTSWPVSFRS